jgi:hypothetical protein
MHGFFFGAGGTHSYHMSLNGYRNMSEYTVVIKD